MSKAFQGFLLCSVLSLPFLGSSNAHAALIINNALSKCLDVKFNNTANGTPLRSVPCSATFGDQWRWIGLAIKGIGTGTSGAAGKCVDVAGGGTADGTLVQLFDCNGTGAQQWIFSNGQIINVRSGKCLDVGDGSNLTQARIRFCNSAIDSQRWALRS
jgi:Ricin-type beta-trefoil lectin domain